MNLTRLKATIGATRVALTLLLIGLTALVLAGIFCTGYVQTAVSGVACSVIAGAIFEALLSREVLHVGPTPPTRRSAVFWYDTSGKP
jgi:hypothetical protein